MSQLFLAEGSTDVMSKFHTRETESYNRIGLNVFNIGFDGNVMILATYFNKKIFYRWIVIIRTVYFSKPHREVGTESTG